MYGNRRRHSEKLQESMLKLDVRKLSFSQRVVNHWNALKQHAIDCNTVNSFKRCVDHYMSQDLPSGMICHRLYVHRRQHWDSSRIN